MSTTIDQKAYLQKYLSGSSKDKKKKKKKPNKGTGFKIIDDDLDLSKLRALDGDELDLFDEGEDAPQIAGIIDERPEDVKKLEQFKTTTKWKVVNQDDGFNSKLQIEEIKQDIKEVEKENELIFGKMYSDSEDEDKKDSDASPPRKTSKITKGTESEKHDNSPKRKRDRNISQSPVRKKHTDSDASPPRKSSKSDKQSTSKRRNSDSDISPPRKRDRQISQSPVRKRQKGSDSDLSPPRKHDSRPKNKQRKASRWGDFEKEKQSDHPTSSHNFDSSTQKSRNQSDSDQSPPRKSSKRQNDYQKDSRYIKDVQRAKSPDSDISPPRRKRQSPHKHSQSTKYNNKNEKAQYQSSVKNRRSITPENSYTRRNNSDHSYRNRSVSPNQNVEKRHKYADNQTFNDERYGRYESNHNEQTKEVYGSKKVDKGKSVHKNRSKGRLSDSDQSPPRRKDNRNTSATKGRSKESDSDQSPPRRKESSRKNNNYRRESESPPPSNKKMAKTLEGKKAGLQDAKQLREENEQFRRKENEVFNQMADEVSGRNAQAVSRRSKRETSEERHKHKEKAERQKELDAKYQKWNRGLKQIQDQEARVQDYLHEAAKPLARFKNDRDLESNLRDVERAGDPMLKYIRERKRERGELPPEKPSYKGSFPPNRFNIRPGYRWDGVDRSNGYEKKYFEQQSKRKAQEEEAYKWSTEDL